MRFSIDRSSETATTTTSQRSTAGIRRGTLGNTAAPVQRPRPLRLVMIWSLLFALCFTSQTFAGGFLTPVDGFTHGQATVLTVDGRVLVGEIRKDFHGFRGAKRFTLRDLDGNRHRLRATEVRSVLMGLDEFSRLAMSLDATTTIEKALETDWDILQEVDQVVYDAIAWPDPDRRVILQRINPGFDSAMQVYHLGNAKEGVWKIYGIPIAGDQEKAFLVVKNGAAPIKIKKRAYEDQFFQLFADCPAVLQSLDDDDADFEDFADHVRLYDRTCGYGGEAEAIEVAALDG